MVAACTHPNPSFLGLFFPCLALAGPQKGSLYVKIFSSNVLQTEAWQPVSSDPISVNACDSLVVWCRAVGNLRRWRPLGAAQLNTKVMWDKGSGLLHSSVSGETESGSALARVLRRKVLPGECRKCFILIDRKLLVSVSESDPAFFLVIGDVSTHLEYRMQQTNLLCFTSL